MVRNDFVALIWGIIGVIVLAIAATLMIVLAVVLISNLLSRKRAMVIVGEDPAAMAETKLELGQFQRIKGTRYVLSAYGPPSDAKSGSLFFGADRAARNYLFVEVDDQTSHYLMPTHSQLVISLEMLGVGEATSKNAPVQWLYCNIVDTDTNGDGRLTEEDGFSVAFANPDGTLLMPVLRGVSKVLNYVRLSGDSVIFFHKSAEKLWMSEINIAERRVVRTGELPS